jgi:hypothetical protein
MAFVNDGFTYATLTTAIQDYCEVDTSVFTATVTDQFIGNACLRVMRDLNTDSDRASKIGSLVVGQQYINAPAGCLAVRSIQITEDDTTPDTQVYLEKRDVTFINEFNKFSDQGNSETTGRGLPKYYAMFGGTTTMDGNTDSSSGTIMFAPCPDKTYTFQVNFLKRPIGLSAANTTNYLSINFPNGLLYACLVEAFGFLKGPMDMLTLYENKYKQEVQKFAGVQIGRRRRDDYTDGTVRIPVKSPSP